jgi:glycosyltransferase involved in cell wall biosynthesis
MSRLSARTRIRLTLYSDATYFGGAEGYLALLAGHLDPAEFEVSLVLPRGPGTTPLEGKVRAAGGSIHYLARPGFRWRSLMPEMVRVLREVRGEVIHLNLPSSYDAGISSVAWAARRAGYRRVISTEHLPMIERKYRRFPVKVLFSHWIDQVIVVAEATRRLLSRRHGLPQGKVVVVPNGVSEPPPLSPTERAELRASWGCQEHETVIGITGQLTRRKGHHLLLQALAGLPRGDFRLVVVGEGEEEDSLRGQADQLALTDRVTWLGRRENGPQLARAFDLFVLPSVVEAMPLTILEAMAAGVPVVSTAIYGIPEVVVEGETGLLVPPHDAPALKRALHRLTHDAEERARMGWAGRRRYEERFTVDRMIRETARIYRGEKALARGSAAS